MAKKLNLGFTRDELLAKMRANDNPRLREMADRLANVKDWTPESLMRMLCADLGLKPSECIKAWESGSLYPPNR
jgi:hypothetical protein